MPKAATSSATVPTTHTLRSGGVICTWIAAEDRLRLSLACCGTPCGELLVELVDLPVLGGALGSATTQLATDLDSAGVLSFASPGVAGTLSVRLTAKEHLVVIGIDLQADKPQQIRLRLQHLPQATADGVEITPCPPDTWILTHAGTAGATSTPNAAPSAASVAGLGLRLLSDQNPEDIHSDRYGVSLRLPRSRSIVAALHLAAAVADPAAAKGRARPNLPRQLERNLDTYSPAAFQSLFST